MRARGNGRLKALCYFIAREILVPRIAPSLSLVSL